MAGFVPGKHHTINTSHVKGLASMFRKFDAQESRLGGAQARYGEDIKRLLQDFSPGVSKRITRKNIQLRAVMLARMSIEFKRLTYLVRHSSQLKLSNQQVADLKKSLERLEKDFGVEENEMLRDKEEIKKEF